MPSVSVNAVANGAAAESPEAVAAAAPYTKTFPSPAGAAATIPTKARGLRRWRRIRRDQERPRHTTVGGGGGGGEGSPASVESRLVLPPARHGAGSGNSEDRTSWSSTAASAPRVPFPRCDRGHASVAHSPRERGSPRPGAAAASISTADDCSRSSVESGLRSSNAVNARQLSQDVRSTTGRCRGNGASVVGRSVRSSAGEESVGDGGNGNGRMYWDQHADPYSESILMLQRAQEALENEIAKVTEIRKELTDEFDVSDDEWSGSVHLEERNQDLMLRINHLESKLEEASALIKEKASRIYELEAIRAKKQPGKTTIESSNVLLSQCELDQLYQERMESEILSIILTRAYQASATLSEDQMTLYQMEKSLSEDYKLLGLKLRHTESRAMVLEKMAEKLQLQCKDLSNSSEVLQLRYKASRVSLFCFVQFLLLCIAMGTYLMRLSLSSTKAVPT